MADESSSNTNAVNKKVAVVLVVVIIAMVSVYAFLSLNASNSDDRKNPHDYVFDGTLSGSPVSGTGHSQYYNESANVYVYNFSFNDGNGHTVSTGLLLHPDGSPFSKDCTDYGTENLEGKTAHKYRVGDCGDTKGTTVVVWIGPSNTVLHMELTDGNWNITAYLSDKVYSISIDDSPMSLHIGETGFRAPSYYPSHSKDVSLTWKSENTAVASVSSDGTVTAMAVGTAKIIVSVEGTSFTASYYVVVSA